MTDITLPSRLEAKWQEDTSENTPLKGRMNLVTIHDPGLANGSAGTHTQAQPGDKLRLRQSSYSRYSPRHTHTAS